MIEITAWVNVFLRTLNKTFGERIWFVGLQGSYGRGEATEKSDLDIVVILDELSVTDIQTYNQMLGTLPHREQICGFLSGKDDIMNWDPSDLFQLYFDTKPIIGNLNELSSLIDETAVDRAIKIGACNIFHGCVHNMLHEKSEEILRGLYKSASYIIQAIAYKQNRTYISSLNELQKNVSLVDQRIIGVFLELKSGGIIDFISMSETLFVWAKYWVNK